MDDGSWLAAVIFPPVILIAGICGVIILIGLLFAFNQIVGLVRFEVRSVASLP